MADAAKACQDFGFDIVDINFGCPVNKVVKCNGGSGLLRDLPLVEADPAQGPGRHFDPVHHEVSRGLERSRTGNGADGAAGRGLRIAGRRAASAHARTGLQREGGLEPHRGSEGGGAKHRGDRQRRYRHAGGRGPHGARDGLRCGDDRPHGFVESLDFPPNRRSISRQATYEHPTERQRYEIMRTYYGDAVRARRSRIPSAR